MNNLVENLKNYKTLTGWLKGERFPHAILIDGPKGTGRRTMANEIAKILLCSGENKPCNVCSSCMKVDKGIHPDLLSFQGEGGARSFHISQVRDLRSEAWVSPNDGVSKVFLLVNTEEMSAQAQNALLKIIEEPPQNVFFILICENQNQMLSTIRSRVAVLTTELVDAESVIKVLTEKAMGHSEDEYRAAAVISGGNIGKALEVINTENSKEPYETAQSIWNNLKQGKELEAMEMLSKFEKDKQGFMLQLELIKTIVSNQLRKGEKISPREPDALRLSKIIDIIENVTNAINGNVSMLLLTTIFPAKISETLKNK